LQSQIPQSPHFFTPFQDKSNFFPQTSQFFSATDSYLPAKIWQLSSISKSLSLWASQPIDARVFLDQFTLDTT